MSTKRRTSVLAVALVAALLAACSAPSAHTRSQVRSLQRRLQCPSSSQNRQRLADCALLLLPPISRAHPTSSTRSSCPICCQNTASTLAAKTPSASPPQSMGRSQLNLDDLAAALGDNRFHADLSLLESDQALRDQWIRENGPQFGVYPDAVFIASAIEGAPSSYTEGEEVSFRLLGDLTIREITQPATFEVSATLDGTTLSGSACRIAAHERL